MQGPSPHAGDQADAAEDPCRREKDRKDKQGAVALQPPHSDEYARGHKAGAGDRRERGGMLRTRGDRGDAQEQHDRRDGQTVQRDLGLRLEGELQRGGVRNGGGGDRDPAAGRGSGVRLTAARKRDLRLHGDTVGCAYMLRRGPGPGFLPSAGLEDRGTAVLHGRGDPDTETDGGIL